MQVPLLEFPELPSKCSPSTLSNFTNEDTLPERPSSLLDFPKLENTTGETEEKLTLTILLVSPLFKTPCGKRTRRVTMLTRPTRSSKFVPSLFEVFSISTLNPTWRFLSNKSNLGMRSSVDS